METGQDISQQTEEWRNWEDDPKFIADVDKEIQTFKNDYEENQKKIDKYIATFAIFNFVIGALGFLSLEDFRYISKIPSFLSFSLGFIVLFWQREHPLKQYEVNSQAYIDIKSLFDNYKVRGDIFDRKKESEAKRLLQQEINKIQNRHLVELRKEFINAINQVTTNLVGDKVK